MITNQLLRPASIVVVGASNNVHKPGALSCVTLLMVVIPVNFVP